MTTPTDTLHHIGTMSAGTPTSNTPTYLPVQDRGTMVTVQLVKGDRGLGFSVARQRTHGKEGKIIVHDIQPGGVAERDGRVQKGDQILNINGQNVLNISHPTVVALLQQAHGKVELILFRCEEAFQTTPTLQPTNQNAPVMSSSRPHPFAAPIQPPILVKVSYE